MAIWTAGTETATNRPGKRWIRYVRDDAEDVRQRMLEHMKRSFPNWNPSLTALEPGQDYAAGLIDAFVHLADVVAVYQDEHVNQSFLGTASREAALLGLADLVDYQPAPGAAASTLQVFLLAEGQALVIPAGQQLEGSGQDGAPVTFETSHALQADHLRNELRIAGFARSTRIFNAPLTEQQTRLHLEEEYAGLAVGQPLVFVTSDSEPVAVELSALGMEEASTTIEWSDPALENVALPVADLKILGKASAEMVPLAAARADELRAGETHSAIADPGLFSSSQPEAGLVVAGGILEPVVVQTGGATIHWDHPFTVSLRKSSATVYRAVLVEEHPAGAAPSGFRVGSQRLGRGSTHLASVQSGDQLIIWDDIGVVRVGVSGANPEWIFLSERLARRFHGTVRVLRVRFTGSGANPHAELSSDVLPAGVSVLSVSGTFDGLVVGGKLVLGDGKELSVHTLKQVNTAREQTQLSFSPPTSIQMSLSQLRVWGGFTREMRVRGFDRSEALTAVGITQLELSQQVDGLAPGHYLVIADDHHAEGVQIRHLARSNAGLRVDFEPALRHSYTLGDTMIYGNVASIEHGVTVSDELLGSGPNQQGFELSKGPLTYVHDPRVEGGAKAAVQLWVEGRRFSQVRDFARSGPADPHYVVRSHSDARPEVMPGNGAHGVKLIPGRDSVRATYRVGLGAEGNVPAGALAQAKQAPDGLQSTFNPVPASGGEDREDALQLRHSVPLVVQTLDRAVSLTDFQLLAQSFAGISKARADWQLEGLDRVVRLTVAAEGGARVTPELSGTLAAYLQRRSSGSHRLRIVDFVNAPLRVELRIRVAADYRQAEVSSRFEHQLEEGYFSFEQRTLGEPAVLAEIYAIGEAVDGVDWLVADAFHLESEQPAVRHAVNIDGNALISGGSSVDPEVGILVVRAEGGLS